MFRHHVSNAAITLRCKIPAKLRFLVSPYAADKIIGEVINVACGVRIDLNTLAPMMCELLGRSDLKPTHGPERAGDVKHSQADITKARELLGYRPVVEFRDGLKVTLDWYRDVLKP